MDNHKLKMLHSSGDCNHRTPLELYEALERVAGGFDVDLAASLESALVVYNDSAHYLGPDHPDASCRDALAAPWHEYWGDRTGNYRRGFLNPPYSLTLYKAGLDAGVERKDLQWLLIDNWAAKAYQESLQGFTTWGVFPYAPQTEWFRQYVMGWDLKTAKANGDQRVGWSGHAALDYWRLPHRVSFLTATGEKSNNANVNTCIVQWGPNPGFVGPWVPSGRYWSYR